MEFSGDQYGARFIQRELETANSDEKDQVYRELMTNTVQLMTDVFGNYVIQKFFEHGNQSQKRGLANQMKSHVVVLSCQMYGCRVVQKVGPTKWLDIRFSLNFAGSGTHPDRPTSAADRGTSAQRPQMCQRSKWKSCGSKGVREDTR